MGCHQRKTQGQMSTWKKKKKSASTLGNQKKRRGKKIPRQAEESKKYQSCNQWKTEKQQTISVKQKFVSLRSIK